MFLYCTVLYYEQEEQLLASVSLRGITINTEVQYVVILGVYYFFLYGMEDPECGHRTYK